LINYIQQKGGETMRKNITDVALLYKKIEKTGLKKTKVAEVLGVSAGYLARKLAKPLDNVEIQILCTLLGLSKRERDRIFFAFSVDKISTRSKNET
jgi:hypothetical protein